MSYGKTPEQVARASTGRPCGASRELPGRGARRARHDVPWRDAGNFGPGFEFSADGHVRAPGEEDPRARFRTISPGFFAALGVPIIAGRDFNDADRRGAEPVVIVSQSLAQRMFPNQDAVNRHMMWTDPIMKFIDVSTDPRRIVGVAADIDDENIVPGPALTRLPPVRAGDWRRPAVRSRAAPIRTRWSRRSRASSATCRRTSRSSGRRRSRTSAPKCSRRTA